MAEGPSAAVLPGGFRVALAETPHDVVRGLAAEEVEEVELASRRHPIDSKLT